MSTTPKTLEQVLLSIANVAARREKNDEFFSCVIRSFDGDPYITRTLFPRGGGDHRTVIHQIHRADFDPHVHNHPWRTARFMILAGGYVEERLVDSSESFGKQGRIVERRLGPGDVNELDATTFHRISSVEPGTWSIGVLGPRVQDWGFLVDGALVGWRDYFAQKGHPVETSSIS